MPDTLTFFGNGASQAAFAQTLVQLEARDATLVPIDFTPFSRLAAQLYEAAWVTERTVAVGALLHDNPDSMDPVVREIIARDNQFNACDAWLAEYLRAELTRATHLSLQRVDALVVPTAPTIRTRAEIAREPVRFNAQFGTYTNFTNLADLCVRR